MNHGHPIDSSLITPSGTILITAGGNEIKLWDLIMGGRLLHTFWIYEKNIKLALWSGFLMEHWLQGLATTAKVT